MGGNQIQATRYLILNAHRIANQDIPDIFKYINDSAKCDVITAKAANVSGKSHPVFQITDKDVVKQERTKTIRTANRRI
jgi:hypothetical protein